MIVGDAEAAVGEEDSGVPVARGTEPESNHPITSWPRAECVRRRNRTMACIVLFQWKWV